MTIITQGQSLVDVAVQELGSVAALFDLADANGLAITDLLTAGQSLTVPASANADTDLAGYFSSRSQRINTGDEIVAAQLPQTALYFSPLFFNPDYFA